MKAMMKKIRRKLEDWMAAAAFAEAGQRSMALEIIGRDKSQRPTARKRPRRSNRMELRARL